MTRYFLDPKNRRGELVKDEIEQYWVGAKGGPGCVVAESLSKQKYRGLYGSPWGESTLEAHHTGQAFTALLPWEV